jgi:SNF2 family DNA or RNA helicase
MNVALLHGSDKEKTLRALTPDHKICVINPEGIAWLTSSKKNMDLLGADMLVIDESSFWKSSTSVRFRALRKYLRTFKRRVILTGSPRPKSYLDLHAQIFILDLGVRLGEYLTHYRNSFFFPCGWQMRSWEMLPGSDKKIDALVAPLVMRLEARDYLKLPKEIEQNHMVDLPPAVRAEYDKIENSLLSTLFTQPLVSSASARSKCAQIANGSVYLDSDPEERWTKKRPVKVVHTAKVEALRDLIQELQGEPILVGIGYKHDVAAICKILGYDVPCINGETTRGQATDYIDRWNKGLIPVLLAHPASAGHGLNLQKFNARNVAYFDIPDNYDTYLQFFLRVLRQGNKSGYVIRHHFIVRNTVDVPKMRNLRAKETGQNAFLAAMKKYSEERAGGKRKNAL